MRPLHILVFLLPLIAVYEFGSFLYLKDHLTGRESSVTAYRLFLDFFRAFGVAGATLPSLALIVVFLTWHLLIKDSWQVDPNTLAGMALESFAWTLPLLVMAATVIHAQDAVRTPHATPALADAGASSLEHLPAMSKFTIAVGAGLYEEMLFRLIGLALLHFILVDLIGMGERWGYTLAILIAAVGFSLYHRDANMAQFVFRTLAGAYLGTVYVMRGFGIVVATHAVFDVLVLVVFGAV